jgi:hypothetical protein
MARQSGQYRRTPPALPTGLAHSAASRPFDVEEFLRRTINAIRTADASFRPPPDYLAPVSASVWADPKSSVEARVEALDGSERKLLLAQLARAHPDVVDAGFALLAEWRTECAEHRRKRDRRHEHERRRRRRETELGRR